MNWRRRTWRGRSTPMRARTASANVDELVQYLRHRANYITPACRSNRLLRRGAAAAGEGRRRLPRVLAGTSLTPAEACSYLYLARAAPSLHRPVAGAVPHPGRGASAVHGRAFLRALLGAPAAWRDTTEIHRRITTPACRRC